MWRRPGPSEERDALIAAVASHVPFDGWSDAALLAGAADIDIEPAAAGRAFPGGAVAMIAYHSALADRRMEAALKARDLGAARAHERIVAAIRTRLEQNVTDREAIRAALAVLSLPQNAPIALGCLYRTVDSIWFAVGDRSTDFGFYTKRATLAGVYLSTVLYWLNDGSEDQAETWGFLDRRIADVMRFQRAKGRLQRFSPPLSGLLRELRRGARGFRERKQWTWRRPEPPPRPEPSPAEPPSTEPAP